MIIGTIIIYILSSILLFFIQNYIEKRKNNYIDNIIISNIYIIILSGILKSYHLIDNTSNIFIIIIFELLIRLFYSNYIKEDNYFKDNNYNQKKYILIIITSYLTNTIFINNTNTVFPQIENIKIIIWLLIVIYLYNYLKDNITVKKINTNNNIEQKNIEKIIINYAKFKNKYYNYINTKYNSLIPLIYSIMIYENENRPEFYRNIDNYIYKFNHKKRKYGIMQVESYYPIDDIKSINISIKHLEKIYTRLNNQKKDINDISLIIKKYYKNDNNTERIIFIYNTIKDFKNKD